MTTRTVKIPSAEHPVTIERNAPFDAIAAIRDHLAFYPDRVDVINEQRAA